MVLVNTSGMNFNRLAGAELLLSQILNVLNVANYLVVGYFIGIQIILWCVLVATETYVIKSPYVHDKASSSLF